jgi:hypothetical protein
MPGQATRSNTARSMSWLARTLALGAVLAGAGCGGSSSAPPELYLWIWQRSEDLAFVDPAEAKVALWVATFTFGADGGGVEIRRNPTILPEEAEAMAVVRVEIEPGHEEFVAEMLALEIPPLVDSLGADEVQIDFDALVSQRDFYRRLIEALREQMPEKRLSITALASWCFGDPWIEDLPIDAAVPMYYRMGPDGEQIRQHLSSGRQIPATICRDNAGYSLDEPDAPLVAAKRIFVFSPGGWDEATLRETRAWLDQGPAQ